MTGRASVKRIVADIMSLSGFHSLAERFSRSGKAFVLMYHRILSEANKQPYYVQPGMFVSKISFEKQVIFLKKRFNVVSLDDIVKMLLGGGDISGHCAITFDDGWRDNYTDAFPVLKKHQVPATIFLATGFVGTNKLFWPEEICYYLEQVLTYNTAISDPLPSVRRFAKEVDRYRGGKRETYFEKSIELLKGYLPSERNEILDYFRSVFNKDFFPRQMLSWNEAKEMFTSGLVHFCAHTDNHVILDQVTSQIVHDEISKSRGEIEKQLGETIGIFAYPNGNHNENIRTILTATGFYAAVTTRRDSLGRETPLMEIPRIGMHEDVSNTIPMFRSRILFKKF